MIQPGAKSPTQVLVVQLPGVDPDLARAHGRRLRARGFNVEVYHAQKKVPNQLKYADRKGIPYVWFPQDSAGAHPEVKDMRSGEQGPADLESWAPAG